LRLVTAAEAAGTPWAIENPADRGDESSPAYWRIHRDHAPLWLHQHISRALSDAQAVGAVELPLPWEDGGAG
jgi:hypothetical protein